MSFPQIYSLHTEMESDTFNPVRLPRGLHPSSFKDTLTPFDLNSYRDHGQILDTQWSLGDTSAQKGDVVVGYGGKVPSVAYTANLDRPPIINEVPFTPASGQWGRVYNN